MLGKGLEELCNSGKIDQRLFDWGTELRVHRNLAAHVSDRTFNRTDAEDLFESANAICEYLFVLRTAMTASSQRKTAQGKSEVLHAE